MVMARKYLNFGGKIIKNLAGKVCFNLLSTVEVKQIISESKVLIKTFFDFKKCN